MRYDTGPSSELFQEILQCARYGDLDDYRTYTASAYIPADALATVLAQRDERGNTPLHYCCANGHLSLVEAILAIVKGRALDVQNEGGNTALHWASLNGHLDCVKRLLDAGADAKMKNKAKRMPVDEAEAQGKESVVLWFLALDMKLEKEALDAAGGGSSVREEEDGTITMTAGEVDEQMEEDAPAQATPAITAATTSATAPADELDDLD